MKKVIFIIGLWIILYNIPSFSLALASVEKVNEVATQVIQPVRAPLPSAGYPPEVKCGTCSEGSSFEIKPSQNPSQNPTLSKPPSEQTT